MTTIVRNTRRRAALPLGFFLNDSPPVRFQRSAEEI